VTDVNKMEVQPPLHRRSSTCDQKEGSSVGDVCHAKSLFTTRLINYRLVLADSVRGVLGL